MLVAVAVAAAASLVLPTTLPEAQLENSAFAAETQFSVKKPLLLRPFVGVFMPAEISSSFPCSAPSLELPVEDCNATLTASGSSSALILVCCIN